VRFVRRNKRQEVYRNKGKARPKLALVGALLLVGSISVMMFANKPINWNVTIGALLVVIAGTLMLLFSMSKRDQIRFVRGLDKIEKGVKLMTKEDCQCCGHQNCGSNHNHWTCNKFR